jgi:hypothetical protein
MDIPDRLPTGGYVLDALGYPAWRDLEAYIASINAADQALQREGLLQSPTHLGEPVVQVSRLLSLCARDAEWVICTHDPTKQ